MDFPTVIAVGFASALFTCMIGFVAARLAFNDLKVELKAEIDAYMLEKITGFLKLVHDKPEIFAPVANGLLQDLQKIIKLPEFSIGGTAVSGGVMDAAMQFAPKKWRVPLMIARMFMGTQSEQKSESKSNPFG